MGRKSQNAFINKKRQELKQKKKKQKDRKTIQTFVKNGRLN